MNGHMTRGGVDKRHSYVGHSCLGRHAALGWWYYFIAAAAALAIAPLRVPPIELFPHTLPAVSPPQLHQSRYNFLQYTIPHCPQPPAQGRSNFHAQVRSFGLHRQTTAPPATEPPWSHIHSHTTITHHAMHLLGRNSTTDNANNTTTILNIKRNSLQVVAATVAATSTTRQNIWRAPINSSQQQQHFLAHPQQCRDPRLHCATPSPLTSCIMRVHKLNLQFFLLPPNHFRTHFSIKPPTVIPPDPMSPSTATAKGASSRPSRSSAVAAKAAISKASNRKKDDAHPIITPPQKTAKHRDGSSTEETHPPDEMLGLNPATTHTPKKLKSVQIGGIIGRTPITEATGTDDDADDRMEEDEREAVDDESIEETFAKVVKKKAKTTPSSTADEAREADDDGSIEETFAKVVKKKAKTTTSSKADDQNGSERKKRKKTTKSAKAVVDPRMERKHTTYWEFTIHCGPCPNTVAAVHDMCAEFLEAMVASDPAFGLHPLGHGAENLSILSSRAALPPKHKALKKYFYFTGDNKQWNNTIRDRPRKINGILMMSTHEDPRELVDDLYVDLFSAGFELSYKPCQALHTSTAYLLLCVPNVLDPNSISKALIHALQAEQQKLIDRNEMNASWGKMEFPMINVRMNYPKHAWDNSGSAFTHNGRQGSAGRGTGQFNNSSNSSRNAAKRCAHIEFAAGDMARLHPLIQAWKQSGGCKALFGPHSYIMPTLDEEVGPGMLHRYKQFLQNHVSYNLSIAVIGLRDILELDIPFAISLEPSADGTPRKVAQRVSTVRQELSLVTFSNNVQLFQCIMQNKDGQFEAVIPNVPEAEQKAEQIARYLAAYCMFKWKRSHWTAKCIKTVMKKSFDRVAVMSAEESCRWDSRQQMVVSKYADDDDTFLDSVRSASWIKMVPLNGDIPTVQAVPGQLRPSSMMAFDHEDGASIKTMRTVAASAASSTTDMADFETAASASDIATVEDASDDNTAPDTNEAGDQSSSSSESSDDDIAITKVIRRTKARSRNFTDEEDEESDADSIDGLIDAAAQRRSRSKSNNHLPAGASDFTHVSGLNAGVQHLGLTTPEPVSHDMRAQDMAVAGQGSEKQQRAEEARHSHVAAL